MTTINCAIIENIYPNNFGNHCERSLAYTLTGELRKHDRVPYYKDSDIPEYKMSVKSSSFTLMSGGVCVAQDFDGIIEEYFSRTASEVIAYVAKNMVAYVMDKTEFREFLTLFCRLERESSQNGGRYKVKMRPESRKTLAWLEAHVASN